MNARVQDKTVEWPTESSLYSSDAVHLDVGEMCGQRSHSLTLFLGFDAGPEATMGA